MNEKKILSLYKRAKELETAIDSAKAELSTIKAQMAPFMVNNELSINGTVLAKIVHVNGSVGVDVKRLQVELPEIFREYLKEGSPSQRFLLK